MANQVVACKWILKLLNYSTSSATAHDPSSILRTKWLCIESFLYFSLSRLPQVICGRELLPYCKPHQSLSWHCIGDTGMDWSTESLELATKAGNGWWGVENENLPIFGNEGNGSIFGVVLFPISRYLRPQCIEKLLLFSKYGVRWVWALRALCSPNACMDMRYLETVSTPIATLYPIPGKILTCGIMIFKSSLSSSEIFSSRSQQTTWWEKSPVIRSLGSVSDFAAT